MVERGFITSRESRGQLLSSLRETDSYQFTFLRADGVIDEKVDPVSVVSDPARVNLEIESIKKIIITEGHARLFGEYLNTFIGMTVEAAFEMAEGIKV